MRDVWLGRLIAAPRDMDAMEALVRAQRFLGANNPRALRRQAEDYVRAAAGRTTHEEHFTPQALRLLALADLLAATQIEGEGAARSEPAGAPRRPSPRVPKARVILAVRRPPTAVAVNPVTLHSLPSRTSLMAAPASTLTGLLREGRRLYAAGWYGPALARFREATRRAPQFSLAYLWWGRAAYRASRFQEARRALIRASDLAGDTEPGRQARALLRTLSAAELPEE